MDVTTKANIRNFTVTYLSNFIKQKIELNTLEKSLLSKAHNVHKFIKDNPDILFTRADKGNTTVAITKNDYIEKMTHILNDSNTYSIVNKNSIRKIETELNSILTRWTNKGFIEPHNKRFLYDSDALLPRAYGVPKIYKAEVPLRIIVSTVNSPLHRISCYLHKLINDNIPTSLFFIKDSFHLFNILSGLKLDNNYIMCSLDVVSLFTNVPIELALRAVESR